MRDFLSKPLRLVVCLLLCLLGGVGNVWGEVVTKTLDANSAPDLTYSTLPTNGAHFAITAVSKHSDTQYKWYNGTSTRSTTLDTDHLLTLESAGTSGQYYIKNGAGNYFCCGVATPTEGSAIVMSSTTSSSCYKISFTLSKGSSDDSGGNDYSSYTDNYIRFTTVQASSYWINCQGSGTGKYNKGTGGWTAFVAFGPYYVATIECVDEDGNSLQDKLTDAIVTSGHMPTTPDGYVLTTDPTNGNGITADGTYKFVYKSTSVKENVYYAIKDLQFSDNSTSYYLSSTHIDTNSNISNQTTPSPALVEKRSSGWYIKFVNESSTPYLVQITDAWTTGLAASGSTNWQIDYVSKISSTTASGPQANSVFSSLDKYAISYISNSKNYYLCAQTSGAQKVYCDNGPNNTSTSANYKMYSTFAFIPMLKVTYNYTYNNSTLSTFTAYLMSGEAYPTVTAPDDYIISSNPVPTGNVTDEAVQSHEVTYNIVCTKGDPLVVLKATINADADYSAEVTAYSSISGVTKDYPGYKPYAEYSALKALMDKDNSSITYDELNAAYTAFTGATAVTPSAGNLYRLKNNNGGRYLMYKTNSSDPYQLQASTSATEANSTFYFNGTDLRALASDCKVAFTSTTTGKATTTTANSGAYKGNVAQIEFTKIDKQHYFAVSYAYNTSTSKYRFIYGAGDNTDAGEFATVAAIANDDLAAGYYWYLEPVQNDAYTVVVDGTSSGSLTVKSDSYTGLKTLTNGTVYAATVGTAPTADLFDVTSVSGYSNISPIGIDATTKTINLTYTDNNCTTKRMLYNSVASVYPYRIPAITETSDGKLLAVSDYRWCYNDVGRSTTNGGRIDIVARTSSDNGNTWGAQYTVAQGEGILGQTDTKKEFSGYGDAAIVTDRESGKILAMTCYGTGSQSWNSGNQGTARWLSTDNGASFTRTGYWNGSTKFSNWGFYGFFSSGRIFQSKYIKVGNYYRIYTAACGATTTEGTHNSFVLYSDDFGESWSVLGGKGTVAVNSGDEAKVEELPDGRVVISSRYASGRYFNTYTYSNYKTAAGNWGTAAKSTIGSSDTSGTNGEIMILPAKQGDKDVYVALNTAPAGSSSAARSYVSVYYKVLSGYNDFKDVSAMASDWTKAYELSSTTSAYSTMVLQKDGNIGFMWEENNQPKSGYSSVESYDIKYLPLSLATATNSSLTINSSLDRKAYLTTYFTALEAAEGTSWASGKKKRFEALVAAISDEPTPAELDAIYNCANGHSVKVLNTDTKGSVTIALADGTTKSANEEFDANQNVTVTAGDGLNGYTFAGFTNAAGESLSTTSPYTYSGSTDVIIQTNWKNNGGGVITVSGTTGTIGKTSDNTSAYVNNLWTYNDKPSLTISTDYTSNSSIVSTSPMRFGGHNSSTIDAAKRDFTIAIPDPYKIKEYVIHFRTVNTLAEKLTAGSTTQESTSTSDDIEFNISLTEPSSSTSFTLTPSSNPGNTSPQIAIISMEVSYSSPSVATYTVATTSCVTGGTAAFTDGTTKKTMESGESVTVLATPADGYVFKQWSDGTSSVSTESKYTFTASANVTLTPEFTYAGESVVELTGDAVTADEVTAAKEKAVTAGGDNALVYLPNMKSNPSSETNNVIYSDGNGALKCDALVLTDQAKLAIPTGFNATTITYERKTNGETTTLGVGKYATIYVPYVFTPGNFKVMEFASYENNIVNFKYVTEIQPNTPYIIRPNNGVDQNLAFNLTSSTNVSTTPDAATVSDAAFYGTYETKTLMGGDGYYGFSATTGTFKKANTSTGTSIKPFRAYFYAGPSTSARPASLGFTEDGGTATAINEVLNAMNNGESLYDLNGRKVENPVNGQIYLMGGKKVMFK